MQLRRVLLLLTLASGVPSTAGTSHNADRYVAVLPDGELTEEIAAGRGTDNGDTREVNGFTSLTRLEVLPDGQIVGEDATDRVIIPGDDASSAEMMRQGGSATSSKDSVPEQTSTPAEHRLILGIFQPWVLAVTICVIGSFAAVTGSVLQKMALRDQEANRRWGQFGELAMSPLWFSGFFVGAVMPFLVDSGAYYLTSMSLVAPLSGVTVVLNMIFAPYLLGEHLHAWPDIPASTLIVLGMTMTTLTGDRRDAQGRNLEQLVDLALTPSFMAGATFLILLISACTLYQVLHRTKIQEIARSHPSSPPVGHVLLPAVSAAGMAVFTNLVLKGAMEVLKSGAAFHVWTLSLLQVAPVALVQLQFINLGLRLYDQTIFFTLYSALMVVGNSMYGALFYQDYVALLADTARFKIFCLGVAAVSLGTVFFGLRVPASPPPAADFAKKACGDFGRPESECKPLLRQAPACHDGHNAIDTNSG